MWNLSMVKIQTIQPLSKLGTIIISSFQVWKHIQGVQ